MISDFYDSLENKIFRMILKEVEGKKKMSKPKAMIDYNKCHPERCDTGVCAAVAECSFEILNQDAPWEAPYTLQDFCVGCGRYSIACPFKAIKLM